MRSPLVWGSVLGTALGVIVATLSDVTIARAQVIPPDTMTSIVEKGGTAALLLFMFWMLIDERKKSKHYEAQHVLMIKEMLEVVHKASESATEQARTLQRVLDGVEKLTDTQKDLVIRIGRGE